MGLEKYTHHLPECAVLQAWDEEKQKLSPFPDDQARETLWIAVSKKTPCSCGVMEEFRKFAAAWYGTGRQDEGNTLPEKELEALFYYNGYHDLIKI